MAPPTYYGVREGKEIGVFKSWEETAPKVTGHSWNEHKSFPSEAQARDYVTGRDASTSYPQASQQAAQAEHYQAQRDNATKK